MYSNHADPFPPVFTGTFSCCDLTLEHCSFEGLLQSVGWKTAVPLFGRFNKPPL